MAYNSSSKHVPILSYINLTVFFLQDEDFTGFGTTRVRQQKKSESLSLRRAKPPLASDRSPEKPLVGKIVPKSPKESQGGEDSPVKDKDVPKVVIKLQGRQRAPTAKAKHTDGKVGRQSNTRSTVLIEKAKISADSGSLQSETAVTSADGFEQEKLVSTPAAVTGAGKNSTVIEEGEVPEDLDTDQSQPQRSLKRIRGFGIGNTGRTSQAVALSVTSYHKRQRKRKAKGVVTSPEAGAEADSKSVEAAVMPLENKADKPPEKKIHRRPRKFLFGGKRKPPKNASLIKRPKLGRNRTKRVFYTYVVEPVPAPLTTDGIEQQLQSQNSTPSVGNQSSFSEQVQQSTNNSSTPTMSGRSSRVIKVPKRFLDEEIIPFPKGPLSTWLKSQIRGEGKPSCHESSYDDNLLQSDSDSMSVADGQSAVKKFSPKPSPGPSHLEIYKNLKKLTLKLAEKKKGQPDIQGDHSPDGSSLITDVKKKQRSKLMMEEMNSPGVVRKLAVVVNADVETPSHVLLGDTGNKSKYYFFLIDLNIEELVT